MNCIALDVVLNHLSTSLVTKHDMTVEEKMQLTEILGTLSVNTVSKERMWELVSQMNPKILRLYFYQTIPRSKMQLRPIDMVNVTPEFVKNAPLGIQDMICQTLIYNDDFVYTAFSWHLMYYIDPIVRTKYVGDLCCQIDDLGFLPYKNEFKLCALDGIDVKDLKLPADIDDMDIWAPLNVQKKEVMSFLEEFYNYYGEGEYQDQFKDEIETDDYFDFPSICVHPEAWSEDIVGPYKKCLEDAARKKLTPNLWKILAFVPIESLEDLYLHHMCNGVPEAYEAMAGLSTNTVLRHKVLFAYELLKIDSAIWPPAFLFLNHLDSTDEVFRNAMDWYDVSVQYTIAKFLPRLRPHVLDHLVQDLYFGVFAECDYRKYIYNLDLKYIRAFVHTQYYMIEGDLSIIYYAVRFSDMPPHIFDACKDLTDDSTFNPTKILDPGHKTLEARDMNDMFILVQWLLRLGKDRFQEVLSGANIQDEYDHDMVSNILCVMQQ